VAVTGGLGGTVGTARTVGTVGTAVVAFVARRHRLIAVLLPLTFVPAAVLGSGATHAWRIGTHLERAAGLAGVLQQALTSAQPADARAAAAALRRETAAAEAETRAPGWAAARRLPAVGVDVAAVTAVVTALHEVATGALPPVVATAERLGAAARGGRLQPGNAASWAGDADRTALSAAAEVAGRASDRVAGIDAAALVPQLRRPVRTVQRSLEQAARLLAMGVALTRLLPGLFAADRPRTWLLLFQNPAELRATGGMPGAWMVVRLGGGALTVVEQGAANMTRPFDTPVLPLNADLQGLYGDRIGRFVANVNLTPDFPTAAGLAAEMYRRRTGRTVDGVAALDPVALSYLLRATGPVTFAGTGTLSAANAVRLLLVDAYARTDSAAAKNGYLAEAARAVFDTVASGRLDARAALAALWQMVSERRLLLWSADAAEQGLIEQLPVAGRLPVRDDDGPTVGVFLNDASGAKLNYYLRTAAALSFVRCATERRRLLRVEATFASRVPPSGLPAYVLGLGLAGDPYTMRLNVSVFAPAGGGLVEARLDGRQISVGSGFERERQVSMATLDIRPGTSRTLVLWLDIGTAEEGRTRDLTPQLWTTPTVSGWAIRRAPAGDAGPTPVTSIC
jgi:hypothetical protein